MSVSASQFWKLIVDSRLITPAVNDDLDKAYRRDVLPETHDDVQSLAQWLLSHKVLSRYQAQILLAGRPGPFLYGDYKVDDRFEIGTPAAMFKAVHVPTGHPVLLHFLSGPITESPQRWAELVARTRMVLEVKHPHLNRCFELVDLDQFKFLVLEDLPGRSLARHLAAAGPLDAPEACRILRQAALGLHCLHLTGQVHGDVRPANLWRDAAGYVKVLFSPVPWPGPIQRRADESGERSAAAAYLPPELARRDNPPDVLSDVYGLGCTLYELLSGHPPLPGEVSGPRDDATTPMKQPQAAIPQPIVLLMSSMTASLSSERPQSAAMVAESLAALIDPLRVNPLPVVPACSLAEYEKWLQQRPAAPPADATVSRSVPPSGRLKPVASSAVDRARGKGGSHQYRWLTAAVAVACMAILAGWLAVSGHYRDAGHGTHIADNGENRATEAATDDFPDRAAGGGTNDDTVQASGGSRYRVVDDDGKLPWASPTSGEPVSFQYVPPSGQAFVIVRPAEMLLSNEGVRVLSALGPAFQALRQTWQADAAVTLEHIDELIVSLHDSADKGPRPSFVVRLRDITTDELAKRWDVASSTEHDGGTNYAGADWSYFVPADGRGRIFVMGLKYDVDQVARTGGTVPALRREVEHLRRFTDRERHFTVLFTPRFLLGGDREIFSGGLGNLVEPLDSFLGDDVQAGMVSMHFDDDFFAELRCYGNLDTRPEAMAGRYRRQLAWAAERIGRYVETLNLHPYGQRVIQRLPTMVRQVDRFTRIGVEKNQVVLTCWLPGRAAHNLVLGAELAVAATPGAATADRDADAPAPKTVRDVLRRRIDWSFQQQSLERAVAILSDEIGVKIKIVGSDLPPDGITRNQQIKNFSQTNKTVSETLVALVRQANPVTTVKDPAEADQKLVWVVAPDPEQSGGRKMILITTRTAAREHGYRLPAAFRSRREK